MKISAILTKINYFWHLKNKLKDFHQTIYIDYCCHSQILRKSDKIFKYLLLQVTHLCSAFHNIYDIYFLICIMYSIKLSNILKVICFFLEISHISVSALIMQRESWYSIICKISLLKIKLKESNALK